MLELPQPVGTQLADESPAIRHDGCAVSGLVVDLYRVKTGFRKRPEAKAHLTKHDGQVGSRSLRRTQSIGIWPFVDTYSTAKDLPILRHSSSLPDGNGMFGAAPSEAPLPGEDRAVRWVSSVNPYPVKAAALAVDLYPVKTARAQPRRVLDLYRVKVEWSDRGAGESFSVRMGAQATVHQP